MVPDLEVEFPGLGWHLAVVTKNVDPLGLYRVRVQVPKALEPESDWLWPFGMHVGKRRGGGPVVPPIGSKALIHFLGGELDNIGVYLPGMFHRDWVPSGHEIREDGTFRQVWQEAGIRVEYDTREGQRGIFVADLQESEEGEDSLGENVQLFLDLETKQVKVSGLLGVEVSSVGHTRISGSVLSLNGRPVLPGSKPI